MAESYFKSLDELALEADLALGASPECREAAAVCLAELAGMAEEFYLKAVSMRRSGRKPARVSFVVDVLDGLVLYAARDGSITTADGKVEVVPGVVKPLAVLCCGLGSVPEGSRPKDWIADYDAIAERGGDLVWSVREGMARALVELAIAYIPNGRVKREVS
jgi:hypothetical protein